MYEHQLGGFLIGPVTLELMSKNQSAQAAVSTAIHMRRSVLQIALMVGTWYLRAPEAMFVM